MKTTEVNGLKPVSDLGQLRQLAQSEPRYEALAMSGARNLGGDPRNLDDAIHWLEMTAAETSEEGVVDEVNFVRDCVE